MNRRILIILIMIITVLFWANISFAQESESEILPLTLDLDNDEENGEINDNNNDLGGLEPVDDDEDIVDTDTTDDDEDIVDTDTTDDDEDIVDTDTTDDDMAIEDIEPEDDIVMDDYDIAEVEAVSPYTTDDALAKYVVRTERFTDEDGNVVLYHYNQNGQILEKVIYLCPPKEITEKLFQDKLFKMSGAFPGGVYTFRMPGYDEPIYYVEIKGDIEIEGLDEFTGEEEYVDGGVYDFIEINVEEGLEEGLKEEDIEVGIFENDSEIPIYITTEDGEVFDDINIEEFTQRDRYFVEDDLLVGPGNYVDSLAKRYTAFEPEQSYLEGIILRESMNYEMGRVTIVIAQDVIVNYKEKTYTCDFKGSYDTYHYLDGVLVTKFEDRKAMKKVTKFDMDSGNPVTERIHHSMAGNTYDLLIFYTNGNVRRQEIFYGGEMSYTEIPDRPQSEFFFHVVLDYYNDGTVKTMQEILLLDLDETMYRAIMPVEFTMEEIERQERVKYAELGISKTYYDNWELVSQVEIYMFGGVSEGDMVYGDTEYKSGMALVRYYSPNGLLMREERYVDDKLYSTIVVLFDEGGYLKRINFVDIHGNVYKFKEGDTFYNSLGESIPMEEFEDLRPAYDFEYLTETYITKDGKEWLRGDDFYTNFQKYIIGFDEEKEDEDEDEDYVEGDDDEDYSDDDIEEGLEEE
jgi:hypothetical protein